MSKTVDRTIRLAKAAFYSAVIFLAPGTALAQADAGGPAETTNNTLTNLGKTGKEAKFDSAQQDPTVIIASVISYALGLIGVLFMLLAIYAGFLWMTAQGNEEQIKKAKTMLVNAVVGVAIVSMAYAITLFIANVVTSSTGVKMN